MQDEDYPKLQEEFKVLKSEYEKNIKGYTQARKEYTSIRKDLDAILASMEDVRGLVIPHPRLSYELNDVDLGQVQKHLEYFLEKGRFEYE